MLKYYRLQYPKTQKLKRIGAPGALAGPRRAKRGILLYCSTSIVAKHQKIEGWKNLVKKIRKVSQCRKQLKERTLWDFSTSILSQNIKKLKGGRFGENSFFFSKKSLTMPKKTEGGPFSLSRYGMLRGKRAKTLLVQFARPNESIWDHKIV